MRNELVIKKGYDPKNRLVTLTEQYQGEIPDKKDIKNAKRRLKRAKTNLDNSLADLLKIEDQDSDEFKAALDYSEKAKEAFEKTSAETDPIINATENQKVSCYLVAKPACHVVGQFTSEKKAAKFYKKQLASTQNQ